VKYETLTFFGRMVFCGSGALCLTLFSRPVQAEMYVAGQVGVSIPNSFSNVTGVGSNTGLTATDLSLQNSVMYGAKLGYYFDSRKWLGVETEVFNSTPHLKQQNVTVNPGVFTGNIPGQHVRVLTWAPINVVVRHQMGQFEPYAGIGLGLFFAHVKEGQTGESSSSTRPGLNTQLGARYLVTTNLALFGEWKYNYARFNFSESAPTQATGGFKGNYSANMLAFGVGYHF
jgi:opacity protein-like surface antigen